MQQGSHGGKEDGDGQPRGKDGEGSYSGRTPTTAFGGEPPRLHGLHARPAAPVWRGRQVKEQEAGVESEGGGEDEGGEGDAVGDQDDRAISTTTWADNSELNCGISSF